MRPEGTQDGNKMPAIKQAASAATLRRLRVSKHKILTPDRYSTYQRNDFRKPNLLHLPIGRKALNFLT